MQRIVAFIENDMYVRNFITSGAFDAVATLDGFSVCLASNVTKLRSAVAPEKICGAYERSQHNISLIYHFNMISMRALRDRCRSFEIKSRTNWFNDSNGMNYPDTFTPAENESLTTKISAGFQDHPAVERIIQQERPELVIFPITGVEATGAELVLLSRRYDFKTLFLINGWDNLSSKGIFPLQPDYLGVWGPQSLLDAVNIQGIPFDRTVLMGCARYEDYFVPENSAQKYFPHRYILFAGSVTPCDELAPLRVFDQLLDELQTPDIKIIYRPHPWRQKRRCADMFNPEEFKHVMLDPQVARTYYKEKQSGTESASSQNYPELKYYPSLVNHAQFIISPMSSMILEAALFDVPALVLAHDDGVHPIPPSRFAEFEHFKGAEEIPGWYFTKTLDAARATFKNMLNDFGEETPETRQLRPMLSFAIRRFLYEDGFSYAHRLALLAKSILAKKRDTTRALVEDPPATVVASDGRAVPIEMLPIESMEFASRK
jgi:hypothetical protein